MTMRDIKLRILLLAFSLALTGLAAGCNRDRDAQENDRVVVEQPPAASETPSTLERQDPEVPPQQVQVVEPETGPDRGAELDAREQELARREADLNTREQRLRETPRREAPRPQPVPRPEPQRQAHTEKPAPQPPTTAPAEPERTEEVSEAPAPAREEPREERREPEPVTRIETMPSGTQMRVEFLESLSSQTSHPGDIFRARVASDISDDAGQVVIPAGSEVVGTVAEAVPLRKVGGQAKLTLRFTDLVLPSGSTVPIHASFVGQGRNETGKDAATIGGAAAGGAIL
jgi:hypothetical protein